MNSVSRRVTMAIAISWLVAAAEPCHGQTAIPGTATSPYQQTLSPYLDLLRSDASTLGPYHSFVRPRQQIRQQLQYQSTQIQRIQRETQFPVARPPATSRLQTGRGGSFNQYLHFYPAVSGSSRR